MKYLLIIFAVILFSSCAKECQVLTPNVMFINRAGTEICYKNFITKANACRFLKNHPEGVYCDDL